VRIARIFNGNERRHARAQAGESAQTYTVAENADVLSTFVPEEDQAGNKSE